MRLAEGQPPIPDARIDETKWDKKDGDIWIVEPGSHHPEPYVDELPGPLAVIEGGLINVSARIHSLFQEIVQ